MIDFPLDGLLDEAACLTWLEHNLHPDGLHCPRCRSARRRIARPALVPAYRCKDCDRYYTALTGTIFQKTRQPPSKIVLMLRGIAKGETAARLSRELDISRKQMHTLRGRVQSSLYETLPTDVLDEPVFEADELYQNAGEKRAASSGRGRPAPAAGQQAAGARHL
jgi:transposase-like protein